MREQRLGGGGSDGRHAMQPTRFPRSGYGDGGGGLSRGRDEYHPEALTLEQKEELHRRNMEALHTPIIGETSEARAMETARLATLAERARLENLQHSLNERARRQIPESSRRNRQLFPPEPQVYRTPVQNLAATTRIAESIQPSRSEVGRGLLQI